MRKYIAVVCIALLLILVSAGTSGEVDDQYGHYIPHEREVEEEVSRIVSMETDRLATWAQVCIAYDSQTGVMYMISRGGGICPMIDVEGNPLIYEQK